MNIRLITTTVVFITALFVITFFPNVNISATDAFLTYLDPIPNTETSLAGQYPAQIQRL